MLRKRGAFFVFCGPNYLFRKVASVGCVKTAIQHVQKRYFTRRTYCKR